MNPLDLAETAASAGTLWARWESKALAALVCLVVLALAGIGAFEAGKRIGSADQKATDAQAGKEAIAQAHADYVALVDRGNRAVEAWQGKASALQTVIDQTKARTAHASIVTRPQSCPDAGSAHLTVAGLMQWNAALGYSSLPGAAARAGGAAAGTEAFDAGADSGVSLGAARDNAQQNFATCAQIRARCQTLIDLVSQRARQPSIPVSSEQP